ncbi:MAG: ligase-associated DNA damage response DEXH box helicase [Bacteroidia bacterium]
MTASAQNPQTMLLDFYQGRGWEPFPFQKEMLEKYCEGYSGLLNAPTGSGKTLAMWLPVLIDWIQKQPEKRYEEGHGLQVLWITPLRALAKDAQKAMQEACIELELPWRVEMRTGDTSSSQKEKQKRSMPECLITTPESLHVLIAGKNHQRWFRKLQVLVVDEWHELLGSKRGVQLELAAAYLRNIRPGLRSWGISATIANMEEAQDVLLGPVFSGKKCIVRANIRKEIEVNSVLPEAIETFPWAGHLGLSMLEQVTPIIDQSKTSLMFTNTRAQAELWYQALLEARPDYAGIMALHHGSLSSEVRGWVEENLHAEKLKLVVCTSSLDLGVDFRPVETVIQVGGPKGVARFLQRAGRAGHQPGALSRIYFVPTHSLELVEAAALRRAVHTQLVEERKPIVQAFDVLAQFLVTLAVGDGFFPKEIFPIVRQTFAYQFLDESEFSWLLQYITSGGESLEAYEEYQKWRLRKTALYKVNSRKLQCGTGLGMGTIVSSQQLLVRYLGGKKLGTVEETFLSTVSPGDTFWFGGRPLELIRIRGNEVLVRRSKKTKGKTPSWQGSRMPLSSQMSTLLRDELDRYTKSDAISPEMIHLKPLLDMQQARSAIPSHDFFLVEKLQSREGHHVFFYPFEGRIIHEMLGALLAYRMAQLMPLSLSIAMNDYGLELLSDQPLPLEDAIMEGLFSPNNLAADLERSVNETMMAQKKFYEIAHIAGLMFRGFPGKYNSGKHLQATSGLLFKVFKEYDPENLLLRQAYSEVIDYQVDDVRLQKALARMNSLPLHIEEPGRPTPFNFPIMVDRLRERLSTEQLMDRIMKMKK